MTRHCTGISRADLLRRGVVGGGVLLASASGLATVAPVAAADTPPDSDLAYLRLLIAAEFLAALPDEGADRRKAAT